MCYLSPEGVVLGADSTTTFVGPSLHFYNHNQKLYEIGENATLGIVTWGLGGLQGASYRTLIAQLAGNFTPSAPTNILEVANRWISLFYPLYDVDPLVSEYRSLGQKMPHDPNVLTPPTQD